MENTNYKLFLEFIKDPEWKALLGVVFKIRNEVPLRWC